MTTYFLDVNVLLALSDEYAYSSRSCSSVVCRWGSIRSEELGENDIDTVVTTSKVMDSLDAIASRWRLDKIF